MSNILQEIEAQISGAKAAVAKQNVGTVREISDGVVKIEGLSGAALNEMLDFGNGVTDHFDWATVEAATKQDFWPDTFSTDWNTMSRTTGVVDMPNVMSKLLMLGMPLGAAIAAGTVNAARIFPAFDDRGTLNVGAPADVAILELREGEFEFLDNYKGIRKGMQRLFPIATVLGGKKTPARA